MSKKQQSKRKTGWYVGCDKEEDHCPCCEKTENLRNKFKCYLCEYKAIDKNGRQDHVKLTHGNLKIKGFYQCNFCAFGTKTPRFLAKHEQAGHKVSLNLKCENCDFITIGKASFIAHMKSKHGEDVPMFKESFKTNKDSEILQCEQCPFQANTYRKLARHIIFHSKPSVKCTKCDHETNSMMDMKKHDRTHKSSIINTRQICPNCGFEPSNKSTLKRQKIQLDLHSCQPLKCKWCKFKSQVQKHMNHHKKTKHRDLHLIFYCNQCQYKSNKKGNVDKHIETVHEGIRIHCIAYENCDKKCTQNSDLRNHLERTHGITVPRLRKKMLKCEICCYKNYRSQANSFHRHVCEPIKCQSCDFQTHLELALKFHSGQQHEPSIYKCSICPYTAEKGSKLKRHSKIHASPTAQ